jgi:hypothetical protein
MSPFWISLEIPSRPKCPKIIWIILQLKVVSPSLRSIDLAERRANKRLSNDAILVTTFLFVLPPPMDSSNDQFYAGCGVALGSFQGGSHEQGVSYRRDPVLTPRRYLLDYMKTTLPKASTGLISCSGTDIDRPISA